MGTTYSNVDDITNFYLENFMEDSWDDLARTYQNHFFADMLIPRKKGFAPSEKTTWNLKVGESDNTVADSLFAEDTLNRVDLGTKAEAKWALQKTHMMWDRREPALRSGSKTQILDYMDMQKADMYDGFFKKNERWTWTSPTAPNNGTAGDVLPNGIPYYITNPTTEAFGFTGGNPTGYSDCAGVDSDTYSGWKNGGFKYTDMTQADFCKKLGEAMDKCMFPSPRPGSDNENVPALDWGLYSSYKPYQDYQGVLEDINDDHGPDAGKYKGGKPSYDKGYQYFRGVPWCWVSALGEVNGLARDLNEPIYGINWSTWDLAVQEDFFMKRDEPVALDNAHNVRVSWMDTIYQIRCRNRRLNFKGISTVASAT